METKVTESSLLRNDGQMLLLKSATYDQMHRDSLRIWCHQCARYGIPTREFIAWLKDYIGDRSAIEIGSGAGDFAHHLGIKGTDSKMQERPDVQAMYEAMGQPVIKYPEWIEKIDAISAVKKYKPKVVFASWVTHWIDPNLPPPPGGGNMYGIKEEEILAEPSVEAYVMLGNLEVHKYKPLRKLPHKELALPFIRSRATYPEMDRVFVWEK